MNHSSVPFEVNLSLPKWIAEFEPLFSKTYASDESKMRLAIQLAMENVLRETGGPFGAAIFEAASGKVVSIGVNRVVPLMNSTAHAEMMAFMTAQRRLQAYRLDTTNHKFILATSAQPCAMCYGASVWAGIERILIGARRQDVESLTEFDEGPMPRNWIHALKRRGISVTRDVLRGEAREVLMEYQKRSGEAY